MIENISTKEVQIRRCPICQSGFLQIEKNDTVDESMICPICGVKFRSAASSDQLMFTETPLNFPNNLVGLWLTRAEIGKALHEHRMALTKNGIINQESQRSIEIPNENPIRAQAVRQAREMIAGGKEPIMVQDVLRENFKLTEYAINEIIQDAIAVSKTRQKQTMQRIMKVGLIALFGLVVVYTFLFFIFG
jgi:Zn-finger nucleic acid-binding protein